MGKILSFSLNCLFFAQNKLLISFEKLCWWLTSCSGVSTCAMQKLIETLKTRQQISLLIMALEPGFLDLVKDLNGNHVVQRCLQCFGKEHNKVL